MTTPATMTRKEIARAIGQITQGSRMVLSYVRKDGEEKHGEIGIVTTYESTAQGRAALASNGEIKPSPYMQAPGLPFGILALRRDPAKLYLGFSKSVRENGRFSQGAWRTLDLDGITSIRIYGRKKVGAA